MSREKVIRQISEQVKKLSGVVCAVLFGSLAENKYTGTSDADLLLIIKEDLPEAERYRKYNKIMADTEVQVFIFTLDEVVSRIKEGDTFTINIITTGIPLFGDSVFEKLKELCNEAIRRYGLVKTDVGWARRTIF